MADFVIGLFANRRLARAGGDRAGRPHLVLAGDGCRAPGHPLDRLHLFCRDREMGEGSRGRLSIARLDQRTGQEEQAQGVSIHHVEHDGHCRRRLAGRGVGHPRGLLTRSGTWVSAALAVAFNFGSFIVEYSVIVAHVRLLRELKERADRLREERYGSSGASASESGSPSRRRCQRSSSSAFMTCVDLPRFRRAA